MKRKTKTGLLSVIAILGIGGMLATTQNTEDVTVIHFIDSGQSDSILIENNDEFALIDAGARDDDELMVGYLKNQDVTKLDYLIVSHFHADHIGGADAVVDAFEIDQVFVPNGDATTKVYEDFILALSNKQIKPSVPLEASTIELGSATLTFYNTKGSQNQNNNSLVVLLESHGSTALFTGDAEAQVEKELTKIGDVDIFKAGHHGSKTSNTEAFLNQITPEKVVIQVGVDNKYQHPDYEVMSRLEEMGIEVYRTDEQGDILITMGHSFIDVNQNPGSYVAGDVTEAGTKEPEEVEYFKNCTLLREVYPDGVGVGHPAYQSRMDRDKDNWACESN